MKPSSKARTATSVIGLSLTALEHCIEVAREQTDTIMLEVALQPLHSVFQRCQDRLALFGIQVAAIYQYGYRLITLAEMQRLAQEATKNSKADSVM
jgi:hypothetical protein